MLDLLLGLYAMYPTCSYSDSSHPAPPAAIAACRTPTAVAAVAAAVDFSFSFLRWNMLLVIILLLVGLRQITVHNSPSRSPESDAQVEVVGVVQVHEQAGGVTRTLKNSAV